MNNMLLASLHLMGISICENCICLMEAVALFKSAVCICLIYLLTAILSFVLNVAFVPSCRPLLKAHAFM